MQQQVKWRYYLDVQTHHKYFYAVQKPQEESHILLELLTLPRATYITVFRTSLPATLCW